MIIWLFLHPQTALAQVSLCKMCSLAKAFDTHTPNMDVVKDSVQRLDL